MAHQPDYSLLDRPEVLQFVFYPRREWISPAHGAKDYLVPVEAGISISCRFYPVNQNAPCILFFHGNGEVASDYDAITPLYHRLGISLFVADYRGYGLSNGRPSFSSMIRDAEAILEFFLSNVRGDARIPLFLMGRSLGTHSAVALVSRFPEHFRGLIVESGAANIARLLTRLGFPLDDPRLRDFQEAALARIQAISLPILVIHGERDSLIPATEAEALFRTVGSRDSCECQAKRHPL